ncbi:MFS transporter, partial [Pantoea sp. SIMBA_072]
MPSLIHTAGIASDASVGLLSAVPYLAGCVFMLACGRSSDRHRERRWHLVVPMIAGAIGLTLATLMGGNLLLSILSLCLAASG